MDNINVFVGAKIRNRRKQLSLSQEELGQMLDISSQQIAKYESGVNKISAGMLFTCAKIMHVPVTYFYDGITLSDVNKNNVANNNLCSTRITPLNILLIEDNPVDEMLFRSALTLCNKETILHTAYNGLEAMRVLRGDKINSQFSMPDIIFLDLNLPKRCGFEVLKEIKQDRTLLPIPVIILTNSINPEDMFKAYKIGATGYMSKSFDINEFNENISSVIDCWYGAMVLPSMQYSYQKNTMPILKEA